MAACEEPPAMLVDFFLLSDERLWGGNKNFPLKRLLNRGCRDSRESRGGGAAGFHEAAPF